MCSVFVMLSYVPSEQPVCAIPGIWRPPLGKKFHAESMIEARKQHTSRRKETAKEKAWFDGFGTQTIMPYQSLEKGLRGPMRNHT